MTNLPSGMRGDPNDRRAFGKTIKKRSFNRRSVSQERSSSAQQEIDPGTICRRRTETC
jgi:hypothetical protein